MAPVLIMLLIGTIEIGNYLQLRQKLEVAASGLGDLMTMEANLSESLIDQMLATAAIAAAPLDLERGRIMVTSLHNPSGSGPEIAWHRTSGAMVEAESSIDPDAEDQALFGGFELRQGDNVIVVELVAAYRPSFGNFLFSPGVLRAQSVFFPRRGSLTTVADD